MAETADTAYRCTLPDPHPGREHWNKLLHQPRDDEDREAAASWQAKLAATESVDLVGALQKSIEAAKGRRRRQIGEHDGDH
jgi:hypothetical protein